jgi:hypothetical protein
MKRLVYAIVLVGFLLSISGCGTRIYISERRLRGPVTEESTAAVARQREARVAPEVTADEASVIRDLEGRVGDELVAQSTFSGRETPATRPMRGARVEPGDVIRISSSRAQRVAQTAGDHCQDGGTRCSNVWVYGRLTGTTIGAWYPIVIFDYDLP